MREFLEVFKYTLKENIRKKSFIVSTAVILVLVVAALLVPAIMTYVQSSDNGHAGNKPENDGKPKSIIYVIDKSQYFTDKLREIQNSFPTYGIKFETEDKAEKLKTDIKDNGKNYLIIIENENEIPKLSFYSKQYGDGPSTGTVGKVFKNIYAGKILKASDVPEDTISKTLGDLNVEVNALGRSKLGGYISSIFIVFVLFFAVYFYGYGVSMSVASEKTSRVMELLVTSVKPSRIILGKTAGMGLLGLMQLALILMSGITTYLLAFPDNFTIDGAPLDFSGFTPLAVVMIIIYFILGYTLYALMNAVVGATVSKAEDVQSAMMPMSFIALIAFYFSYGTFAIPDSTAARAASLIPFTAPFSVPSRLISTEVPAWEIALSLLLLSGTIIIVGTVSIKLYSFAVLHYGDRLKISKLFKISKSEKSKAVM